MDERLIADQLRFYTDASANSSLGFGCIYDKAWMYYRWENNFIEMCEPNIEFLELYALCIAIFTCADRLCNKQILIFCDNQAVIAMVNNTTSGCKFCMTLIIQLMILCMEINLRIFVRYVKSAENILADCLSRMDLKRFERCAAELGWEMDEFPSAADEQL